MERRKLLVVDDEPQIRNLISEALSGEYEVLTAETGEEAIRRAVVDRPSCILMDVMMPQMGGFMLCDILKGMRQTKLIPIILMSAKPRQVVWPTAQEMGVLDYLEKPFSIRQMSISLKRALATSPIELRRAPRVTMKIPITVRGKDDCGNEFEVRAETENVSRFGALVRLPFRLPVGERVEICRPGAPTAEGNSICTQARIAWNDESYREGPYLHGCEFSQPSPEWVITE
jgi:CheY-like chemotaxis protein